MTRWSQENNINKGTKWRMKKNTKRIRIRKKNEKIILIARSNEI